MPADRENRTLTTNIDNLKGTAQGDTFTAGVTGGGTGAHTVTLTKAQMGGLAGSVGAATQTFTFKDATAATNDAAKIALDAAKIDAGGGDTVHGITTGVPDRHIYSPAPAA